MSETNVLKRDQADAKVTLAVISDMHCRLSSDDDDSFLQVGALRKPSNRHPVEALLSLIKSKNLTADALLLPGDLANKARLEGLGQSWDFALELGGALKTDKIIPVIGNHDVDSRRTQPNKEPFYNVRNLRPGFPYDDLSNQSFFSDGFCFKSVNESCEIIAVNTVIDHHDEKSAMRGSFDLSRISNLSSALKERVAPAIRVALMHHHPILHTGPFFTNDDVIPNGDVLVETLRQEGCRLIIHGHRHLARLTVLNSVAVLASGSFSANLGIYASSMGNMFHLIEVEATGTQIRGKIQTWVFHYGSGWGPARPDHSGFPHATGFGRRNSVINVYDSLASLTAANPTSDRFVHADLVRVASDLPYLTPTEMEELTVRLREQELHLIEAETLGQPDLWRTYKT